MPKFLRMFILSLLASNFCNYHIHNEYPLQVVFKLHCFFRYNSRKTKTAKQHLQFQTSVVLSNLNDNTAEVNIRRMLVFQS